MIGHIARVPNQMFPKASLPYGLFAFVRHSGKYAALLLDAVSACDFALFLVLPSPAKRLQGLFRDRHRFLAIFGLITESANQAKPV